jgi:hypothetical protein
MAVSSVYAWSGPLTDVNAWFWLSTQYPAPMLVKSVIVIALLGDVDGLFEGEVLGDLLEQVVGLVDGMGELNL